MFENLSDIIDEQTGEIKIVPRELYIDLLDKENSRFVFRNVYRVCFTDGKYVDICEEDLSALDVGDDDLLAVLQEIGISKRGMEDMATALIQAMIKEIKEAK